MPVIQYRWRLVAAVALVLLAAGYIGYSNLHGIERKALALLNEGEFSLALELLEPALKNSPRNTALAQLYAQAATGIEDWERMRKLLRQRKDAGDLDHFVPYIDKLVKHCLEQGHWKETADWYDQLYQLNQLDDVDGYMELIYNIAQYRADAWGKALILPAIERYPNHPLTPVIEIQTSLWGHWFGLDPASPNREDQVLHGLERLAEVEVSAVSPRIAHLVEDFQRMLAIYAVLFELQIDTQLLRDTKLYLEWNSDSHPLGHAGAAVRALQLGDKEAALAAAAKIPETGLDKVLTGGGWDVQVLMGIEDEIIPRSAVWSPCNSQLVLTGWEHASAERLLLINVDAETVTDFPGTKYFSWNPAGTALASDLPGGCGIWRHDRWQQIKEHSFVGWLTDQEVIVSNSDGFHVYHIDTAEKSSWAGSAPAHFFPNATYAGHGGWRVAGQRYFPGQGISSQTVIVDFAAGTMRFSPGYLNQLTNWHWSSAGNKLAVSSGSNLLRVYDIDKDWWFTVPVQVQSTLVGWHGDRLLFCRGLTELSYLYYSVDPETLDHQFHYLGNELLHFPSQDGAKILGLILTDKATTAIMSIGIQE